MLCENGSRPNAGQFKILKGSINYGVVRTLRRQNFFLPLIQVYLLHPSFVEPT
jgi:hypothetical protein